MPATPDNPDQIALLTICGLTVVLVIFALVLFVGLHRCAQQTHTELTQKFISDILVYNHSKTLYLNKDLLDSKHCRIYDKRHLKNNTGQNYNAFKIKLESWGTFLDYKQYKVKIDKDEYAFSSNRIEVREYDIKLCNSSEVRHGQEIQIRLGKELNAGLPPDKSTNFTLIRETNTMNKLFELCSSNDSPDKYTEKMGAEIYHETEYLKLECKLSCNLIKAGYYFASDVGGNGIFNFEVIDGAFQPMVNYKNSLIEKNMVPRRKLGNGIIWEIQNPHVGYTYRMSFCLCNRFI